MKTHKAKSYNYNKISTVVTLLCLVGYLIVLKVTAGVTSLWITQVLIL